VTVVAIVDLDNTLIRGSYLFHFGAHLVRQRVLSPRPLVPFMMAELRYVRDREERPGMPKRVTESVLNLARGRDQETLVSLCRDFVDHSLSRFVVAEALEAVADLRDLGIPVYIATASPQELAEVIADRLGLAGGIGTISEVRNGKYTGRLSSPVMHGKEKKVRVHALLDELGADASRCWAFSDSANDLPLLESVGWPVAVNADARLSAIARTEGWLTIDSSKDVPESRWTTRWTAAPARWLRDDPVTDIPMH
jgi:HAD superfamily hydrolase (TIGR01490 family)